MTLSLSKISTSEIGYHPFYVTVSNTTSNTEILTLSPNIATDGAPTIEIRGEDGREKGQIELPPNSQAIVYGLITIDEDVKYGSHPITIELKKGDAVVSSQIITVEYLEPNLLQNPGIENDSFTPWWQTASFFPDTSEAHSGNKSIKFSGNHGADSGYNIRFPVRSGYAYELSFWAKRSSDSLAGVRMRITELDESVNLLRATEEIFELTDTWEKYTMAFYVDPELNPDYSFSWYNIYLVGDGTIWLDDFVLRELGKIEGYVKPSDPLPNIVRNGSFEEDSAWIYESGSRRIKYDDAIDGDYVLYVDMAAKEADNRHPYQSGLSVQKNHVYRLGFDAKRSGEDADGRIRFDLTPFPLGQGLPVIRMEVTPTEEWMRYEMLFVSPDDEIFNGSYWPDFFVPGSKGYLYVDNITLHDLGEATEPVDSTITSKPSVKTLPDGVGNGTIVPPSLGDKPEISPPDFNNIGNDGAVIFIAATDSYPDLALLYDEDVNFIGDSDGFAVRLTGNTVYIFGTNADGTLNGVYDFIETNLGVLWTRSIDLGTLYDPMPTIELIRYDYHDKSPFRIRGWHLCGNGVNGEPHSDPGTEIMMSRNKLNGKFAEFGNIHYWDWQKSIGLEPVNLGHNIHYWLLQSPTYQSLSEEEQAKYWNTDSEGNPTIGRGQLNFWNPDVAVAIAESVNAFLNTHDIKYVGVGMEDTGSCVQKPEDELPFEYEPGKFVQPDDPKYLSTVFFSFINKVAQLVKSEHPDVTLTTYAYVFTETPPYGGIEDNVSIVIAPINEDMKVPLTDPDSASNRKIIENMLEWTEKTNNIMVYNYYGCFPNASDEFERPIASRIQSDLRFYAAHGFTGLLPEGLVDANNNMWAVNTLTMWLYSKLAWNPDADIQALTELFCQKAYGDAAEHMLEYYRLLQETWDNNYTLLRWNATLQTYVKTFYGDPEHNAKMQAALDRAWDAANDIQKQRIAPIKEAFEKNTQEAYEFNEKAVAKRTDAGLDAVLNTLDMSDPIWADVPVLEDFRNAGNMQLVEGTKTKVRLLWDDNYLYVAYENFDSGISDLKMTDLNTTGNWWAGESDDVETYISAADPTGNPDAAYRVYFSNPLGKQIVYKEGVVFVADPGEWYTNAAVFDEEGVENDRWVIIQAIPFEQLGIETQADAETEVYGYFYRGYYGPGGFINIGWGGAPVWSPAHFHRITLAEDEEEVTLESIEITSPPDKTEYVKGEELDLTGLVVTAKYSDGSEEAVTDYSVSGYDKDIVGEQTITVTYEGKTATFTVTVTEEQEQEEPDVILESIEITSPPDKTEYVKGEELDLTGLVVTAIFSDGTEIEITDYSVSGYDKDIAGEQTITVTYEGKTATFTVTVTDMQDDEDDKDEDPVKTGDSFSPIFLTLLLLLSFGTIIYLTVKRKILNRS